MPAPDTPDSQSVTKSGEKTSAPNRDAEEAQLCPQAGVSTDVSSVAIDRGMLGREMLDRGISVVVSGSWNCGPRPAKFFGAVAFVCANGRCQLRRGQF